jgi:hypothetical protein
MTADDYGNELLLPDSFVPHFSSWPDDFYQTFNIDDASFPDFDMPEIMLSVDGSSTADRDSASLPEPVLSTDIPSISLQTITGTTQSQQRHDKSERPAKKAKLESLPVHLLAQHFSRQLTGRYSFKSADWTFYTYFFHRFTTSHPWVLSSILAWTSAHLFYSGKAESLNTSLSHYDECISHMSKKYGRTIHEIDAAWPTEYDEEKDAALATAATDDVDAIFVGHFFLALFDLITARPHQIRKILRFIAHVLHIPGVGNNMGGVRSRVATWVTSPLINTFALSISLSKFHIHSPYLTPPNSFQFCILDGKASAFQPSDGAVLQAIGSEAGLVTALHASYSTLQQVYSVTYPDEERRGDETHLPLLERMLRIIFLLHSITLAKQNPRNKDIKAIREKLDAHRDAIAGMEGNQTENFQGRSRSTFLVLTALYNSAEISYSRAASPSAPMHSADVFAMKIIQVAQQLNALRTSTIGAPPSSPPPTKIWPLPLVMAAVEVRDPIYREWVLDRLKAYEEGAGDHYVWARRFVEAMVEREARDGRRVDWGIVLADVSDGLVV